jgi:hypothetical protein
VIIPATLLYSLALVAALRRRQQAPLKPADAELTHV